MDRVRNGRPDNNFRSNPSFGYCGNDNDYNNGNYYEGRNNDGYRERGRFQRSRGSNNGGNFSSRRPYQYYNLYYNPNYNNLYNPKSSYPEEEEPFNEEKEKLEDEKQLKNKY